MAIEAMTEINSDTAAHLKINGYTLRNIVISAALVVPDDDSGVETLFSVHPHESIGSNQWYCFNVSSRSFGAWKHHTKGIIGINMRSRGESSTQILIDKESIQTFSLRSKTYIPTGATFALQV